MGNIIDKREIHEAINAADDALDALRRADKSLSGAAGLGLWDMLGGGFLAGMLKHDRMDQAQNELEEARSALMRFRRELGDLGRSIDLSIDMDEFLRFADLFFDNAFSDFMVQSRIQQGRRKVQQAITQIEEIRRQLWAMLG